MFYWCTLKRAFIILWWWQQQWGLSTTNKFKNVSIAIARCNHRSHLLLAPILRTQFAITLSYVYFCYEKLFQKIPVELPKPFIPKVKNQSLLRAIVVCWYIPGVMEKIQQKKIAVRCNNSEKETMIDVDNFNTTYQDIITNFVLNTILHHVGMWY